MVAHRVAAPFKVFVVEPQALFASALAALFDGDPRLKVVGVAPSFEPESIAASDPDVVVVDLDAEPADRTLLAFGRVAPHVCVLSANVVPGVMRRCFESGARGFIGKDAEPAEVVRAVAAVAARGSYPGGHAAAGLAGARTQGGLSARETEVLRLLGACMSNKEIAERLGVAERTVKAHVSNVLAKLHVDGRTQAAVHAVRSGLL